MSLSDLIINRRTIHDYKPEVVDWNIVSEALNLSLWSLNHKLTYPWVYIRVGNKVRQVIADIMVEATEKKKGPLSEAMKKSVRNKVLNPSELIFLGFKKSGSAFQEKEDYATLACSIQIASLYLWDKGIGTKWSTGAFTSDPRSWKALGVNSEEVEIIGCLFVGVPERTPKASPRPQLSEVLRQTE